MKCELATAWAATDEMRKLYTTITISENLHPPLVGTPPPPVEALNTPCESRWWKKNKKMKRLKKINWL